MLYPAKSGSALAVQVRVAEPAVASGLTVSETGMVLLEVPGAETVMVPLKIPAVRPLRLTLAPTVPVLVPEVGESVNHAALSPAVQLNVPVPVFEMVMD